MFRIFTDEELDGGPSTSKLVDVEGGNEYSLLSLNGETFGKKENRLRYRERIRIESRLARLQ
jgi:hypothetical protein